MDISTYIFFVLLALVFIGGTIDRFDDTEAFGGAVGGLCAMWCIWQFGWYMTALVLADWGI